MPNTSSDLFESNFLISLHFDQNDTRFIERKYSIIFQ